MPGIIAFPTVVEEALEEFGGLFANAPERRHFGEYLTGLVVTERKNVSAINAEFADTTDQCCLNRWITQVPWDEKQLNEHRLDWLHDRPSTRYSARGVIAIDNTLVKHSGEQIEDAGWFWDHAEKRHLIAHDYVIANYVCTSGKYYPLEYRRFRKREGDTDPSFKSHSVLFKELVEWVVFRQIPGAFAFVSYFSSVECLDHVHGHERGYVGALKSNRNAEFQGRVMKAAEVAASIPSEDRKRVCIGDRKQSYFTKTMSLPKLGHRVRLVILWGSQERQGSGQVSGHQPRAMGDPSYSGRVSQTLDGHRDLSSGRQASSGHGRLSVTQRRGPDPAYVPRDAGAQSADGADAGRAVRVIGLIPC